MKKLFPFSLGQILIFLFFVMPAQADFTKVIVKMQSGETIPIMELPWFKFQFHVYESQWKNQASTADWAIYAPPKSCILSSYFRLNWQSGLSSSDLKQLKSNCDAGQQSKFKNLSLEDTQNCSCNLILRTEEKSFFGSKSVWVSHDDTLLKSDEFKLFAQLIDKSGNTTPIILSLGSHDSGLYSVDGQRICRYSKKIEASGAYKMITKFISEIDTPIPISCIGESNGLLLLNKVSYSLIRSKLVGDIDLKFENGENYVIKFL